MKLKDLVSITKNSKNSQSNWSIKKRKLKQLKVSEEDVLDIEIDNYLMRYIK